MNENFFPFVNSLEYYEYLYSGTDLSFCDWKPNKEQKERIKRLKEKHRQFYADKRPNTRHKEGYISPKDRIDSYIAIFVKNNAEIMEQLKNKVKCIDVAQDYGIPLCSFKKILFELHPNFKFNRKKLTDE